MQEKMKKEIIIGIMGSIVVLAGAGCYIAQYQRQIRFYEPISHLEKYTASPPLSPPCSF